MKKKIFLHVGAGKTGTTALQEFFYYNLDLLKKINVTIPNIGVVMAGNSITHHKLADWGPHRNIDTLSLWREIAMLKDQCVLLSSEYFHSRISEKDGVDFFCGIRDILTNHDIKVIFYIRRQSEWIQSAYEQWVKANALSLTIEQFSRSYKKNLSDQIFRFAKVFGRENIIVKPYDKNQFKKGNIYSDFFDALGLDIDDSYRFPTGNINPRLTADALNFKRVFNSYCKDKEEARIVQEDLGQYSKLARESKGNLIQSYQNEIPSELQKSIEEDNKTKYEKIARDFLGRDNGKLFSEDARSASTTPKPVDLTQPTDTSQLYPYLFLQMYKKIHALTRLNNELEKKLEHIEKNLL